VLPRPGGPAGLEPGESVRLVSVTLEWRPSAWVKAPKNVGAAAGLPAAPGEPRKEVVLKRWVGGPGRGFGALCRSKRPVRGAAWSLVTPASQKRWPGDGGRPSWARWTRAGDQRGNSVGDGDPRGPGGATNPPAPCRASSAANAGRGRRARSRQTSPPLTGRSAQSWPRPSKGRNGPLFFPFGH